MNRYVKKLISSGQVLLKLSLQKLASLKLVLPKLIKKLTPRWRLKSFIIAACAFLLFGVASFFIIQIYIGKSAENFLVDAGNAPDADAVMILGALVYKNGSPSYVLKDRLDYGYELYSLGKAKKILVSGDHGTKGYDEVNSMKEYLMQKGVPREDIFMDHAGFNTYDSMYRAREIFGIKKLLISTQQFHMSRSIYIARRLGIDAYGYASEDKPYYNMKYLNFRESFARVKAFLDADILKRKPKYLGDTIPIMGSGAMTDG